ncbi:hypothetical protein FSO04_10360 [Paraburkholderia madseniana]|uniref:Integrase n=1 Tax=Paraburkholderia madseniana TaxID=2599607 RepID=A0A6N6WJF8_9BURK|nr:hypothetical protein FSO04_10360 [Paraburkholderia madseniana]
MTKLLTAQYDRVINQLEDTPANRKLVHRYIDVWEYPDGRIEVRADGTAPPYVPYARLSEIDHDAVIGHKRLGHALQVAQALQPQHDNRRASGSPSRTNRDNGVEPDLRPPGTKKHRELTQADVDDVIMQLALQHVQTHKLPRKPRQRPAGSR